MKSIFTAVLVLALINVHSQEYYVIDFIGDGATIENIYVENLTQGTSLEMSGTEVLHLVLKSSNHVSMLEYSTDKLSIYPNPMDKNVNIEFFNAKQGTVSIMIYSICGIKKYTYNNVLPVGLHSYILSGLAFGSYIVNVITTTDYYSGFLVSISQSETSSVLSEKAEIDLINTSDNHSFSEVSYRSLHETNGTKSIVEMDFDIGDELKFIGTANGFDKDTIFSSPTGDQTYTFEFIRSFGYPCPDLPEFTDPRDGNVYRTVIIRNQCWMAENLAYLPDITYEDNWGSHWNFTIKEYAVYSYAPGSGTETVEEAKETDSYKNYGVLYNWAAAMNGDASSINNPSGVQAVCPPGWHLPSESEWRELLNYIISESHQNLGNNPDGPGNALKSCRQVNSPIEGDCNTNEHPRWNYNNTHYGNDKFGFSALPGGYRHRNGTFYEQGGYGLWWTATELQSNHPMHAWHYVISFNYGHVVKIMDDKEFGLSVRCVKDE